MFLTSREAEVLGALMAFEIEPLVFEPEKKRCHLGTQKVHPRTLALLLRKHLVTQADYQDGCPYYAVNEAGREVLRQHWGIEI